MKRLRGLNALMHGGGADRAAIIRGLSIFQLAKRQWSMHACEGFQSVSIFIFIFFLPRKLYLTQNIGRSKC